MKKLLRILLLIIIAAALIFAAGRVIDRFFAKPVSNPVTETDISQNTVKPDEKEESRIGFAGEKLAEEFKLIYGNVPELSFYIKDLNTGADYLFNDKPMNSASVIKLFIALTAYEQDGMEMDGETKEWLEKMITESHNDSSNSLIDKYTFGRINRVIYKNGYSDTELRRKMYNTLPPGGPSGEDNLTSAKDVGILLERVYNGSLVNKECSADLLNHLKNQKRVNKIPAKLANKNVTVYNKTGELSSVENDVAIITGTNAKGESFSFIFCVFVNDIPNNETQDVMKEDIQDSIADMALELVTYFENPDEYVSSN